MFGLSFAEIMVICAVALLVVGPDKLPEVARTLGKTLNQFKNALEELKRDVALPTVQDLKRELISVPNRPDPPQNVVVENPIRANLTGTCEEYKTLQAGATLDPATEVVVPVTAVITSAEEVPAAKMDPAEQDKDG